MGLCTSHWQQWTGSRRITKKKAKEDQKSFWCIKLKDINLLHSLETLIVLIDQTTLQMLNVVTIILMFNFLSLY